MQTTTTNSATTTRYSTFSYVTNVVTTTIVLEGGGIVEVHRYIKSVRETVWERFNIDVHSEHIWAETTDEPKIKSRVITFPGKTNSEFVGLYNTLIKEIRDELQIHAHMGV